MTLAKAKALVAALPKYPIQQMSSVYLELRTLILAHSDQTDDVKALLVMSFDRGCTYMERVLGNNYDGT